MFGEKSNVGAGAEKYSNLIIRFILAGLIFYDNLSTIIDAIAGATYQNPHNARPVGRPWAGGGLNFKCLIRAKF